MAAKIGSVKAEIILRVGGHEATIGTLDMPVKVGDPDHEGHAVVSFPKDQVRRKLKKLGKRIARDLA